MKDEIQVLNVNQSELPKIITNQWSSIERLDRKVKQSMQKANDAKDLADRAWNQSAGFGHKKEAIESLQTASVALAESQVQTVEAQKLSFEYQKQLSEITKYLFALGVSNIAANRTVVRELQLRLKDASESEISELAKREIFSVISQLKAQEDIMEKQEKMSKLLHEHDNNFDVQTQKTIQQGVLINNAEKQINKHEKLIAEGIEKDKEQDKIISEQADKDLEHDKLIAEGIKKDKEQDKIISEQADKDLEHDKLIAEGIEKDKEQDKIISEQAQKDIEHDKLIAERTKKDEEHDNKLQELEIENEQLSQLIKNNKINIEDLNNEIIKLSESKSSKTFSIISFTLTLLALIIGIIQFFL